MSRNALYCEYFMKLAEGKLMIDILVTVRLKHSYFKHAINFLFMCVCVCVCCQHSLTDLDFYVTKYHDTDITLQHKLCSWLPVQSSTFALVNRL